MAYSQMFWLALLLAGAGLLLLLCFGMEWLNNGRPWQRPREGEPARHKRS
jgi:hypothetical protein